MARDLPIYADFEAEVDIKRKAATTGNEEAAAGLSGVTFRIAGTPGGAALGSLSVAASERSAKGGRYHATFDTGDLVSALAASHLNVEVYLVVSKSGDFDRVAGVYIPRDKVLL